MVHIPVMILIFFLLNAIDFGEASPKIPIAALSPWYCHRLVPAFITSAVTPCTYPCLFVSPNEHPQIVVHPEPDETPCRITTGLNHHFKVGTCRGSVCHTTTQHATLKRKKRFICLYALVKLLKTKRKLKELKEAIRKLESEGASGSSRALNARGGQGRGRSGSNVGNRENDLRADSLTGPSGSPRIGDLSGSTDGNPLIGNSGVRGRPGSGLGMNENSAVIDEMGGLGIRGEDSRAILAAILGNNYRANLAPTNTDHNNGGTYGVPDGTFPRIGNTAAANSHGRGTGGFGIGGSSPRPSTGMNGGEGVNAVPERFPSLRPLDGTGSTGFRTITGSSLGLSGVAGTNSNSIRLAFSGGGNNGNPTVGGTGTGNGGSGIAGSGGPSAHPGVASGGLGGGTVDISPTVTTIGRGTSDAGIASIPPAFPSGLGFGDDNTRETDTAVSSGANSANSGISGTSVGSAAESSTAVASVSGSRDGGVSNSAAIVVTNSNIVSSRT